MCSIAHFYGSNLPLSTCHSQSRLDNLPEKPILFLLCRWIQQSFFVCWYFRYISLTLFCFQIDIFNHNTLIYGSFSIPWIFDYILSLISSLVPASTRICSNLNSINWINDWQKLIKSDSNNWLLALVVYITQLSVINVCSEEEFLVSIPSFPQSAAVLLCQLCRVIDSLNICLILINIEMSFSLSLTHFTYIPHWDIW